MKIKLSLQQGKVVEAECFLFFKYKNTDFALHYLLVHETVDPRFYSVSEVKTGKAVISVNNFTAEQAISESFARIDKVTDEYLQDLVQSFKQLNESPTY